MARIALIAGMAVAGAFISVATGGLGTFAVGAWASDIIAGAAVGASVGNMLSNIIFPPHANSAPPMNDLQSMSSAFGSPICWGYGGYRVAGQVIAAQKIKVHKNKQKSGGKGGGPTSTVYTYTVSAAISFGFGPGNVVRLWADSKLIYDKAGKGPVSIDTGLSTSNGNAITTPFKPVFYTGTSTQLPDPTVEAFAGANVTSGYRDQIYMVITDFPLADYGNRLPNFRAEVTSSTGLSYIKDLYPQSNLASPLGFFGPAFTHIDATNRLAYVENSIGDVLQKIDLDVITGTPATPWGHTVTYAKGDQILDGNGNIQLCFRAHISQSSGTPTWSTSEMGVTQVPNGIFGNIDTWQNMGAGPDVIPIIKEGILTWQHDVSFPGMITANGLASGVDTAGNFWTIGWQDSYAGGTGFHLLRFNASTFVNDKSIYLPNSTTPPTGPYYFTTFTKCKSGATGKNYLYYFGGYNQQFWVVDAGAGTLVNQGSWTFPGGAIGGSITCSPPAIDPQTGIAYCAFQYSSDNTGVMAIDPRSGGITMLWTHLINYADFGGAAHEQLNGIFWDASDNTVLLLGSAGALVKLNSATGAIIQAVPNVVAGGSNLAAMQSKAYDGLVPSNGIIQLAGFVSGALNFMYIRTRDLTVVQSVPLSNWLPALGGSSLSWMAYDALTNSMFMCATSSAYAKFTIKIYFDRQAVAEQDLQTVVEDIWARTGADPAWLDASALSGLMVKGYPITQQSTGKGLLGPLQAAFFFDLVETDNKLKAVRRGQSVTTVIPEDDLGLLTDNYEASPTIVQEHDLPIAIGVNYYDKARDYQQGRQVYRRSKKVKKTRNKTEINLPMTLSADDAAAISAKCLQTAWSERNQWEFKLWRQSYLVIDPTDVVEFTYQGAVYQSRIGKTSTGANKVIEITAVSEDPKQYTTSAKGSEGNGFSSATIAISSPSVFFILDTPFLTDSDANPTGSTGYYWSMTSANNSQNWSGGILFDSADNNEFTQVGIDNQEVTYGQVPAATPPPTTYFAWDKVNTVQVYLQNGATLTSASDINVLNGANMFYLGGELMGFSNATLQADGSYILDTLLRGLRGTEGWCKTHQSNETFVLLDTTQQRQTQPTSVVGVTQYFRGITLGQPLTTAASTPTTLVANDLKPYAPAQFLGSPDGSFNMNISWVRRTRIGGSWNDGTGTVPVSEEVESYDLDIMQLNLQQRTTDPTYVTTPSAGVVRTTFESSTFYQYCQPFSITWEDGVTANYAGFKTTVGLEARTYPWFFWVHDPNRLGDPGGASYGSDAPPYADDTQANAAGYYLIGVIPAFLTGSPVSYYVAGEGGDAPVRKVNVNSPAYVYTAAQMIADFGRNEINGTSAPGFVRANLYQISAAVGRGFATKNPTLGSATVVSGGSDATSILGVSITGTPVDGDVLQYNASAGEWQIVGPLLKRQTLTKTTASIANNASETGTFAIGCGTFAMLYITVDRAARVQFYATAALRDADAGRAYNTPPAEGSQNGIIADFGLMAGGVETWSCSPPLIGANTDGPPADQIYYRITNLSGSSHTVAATIVIVPLEVI